MKNKTSKGLFAAVLSQLSEEKEDVNKTQQQPRSASPHLMKVAAGVKEMQARSQLADEMLRKGSQIVEIDPEKIKQSPIKDRLENSYDSAAIAELEASMRERGQIVPGLVRPVAGKVDEFEIVYGRRRLAVAKRLGIAFKAAIRNLSDDEAIIFQGEENTARNDLSFIEKCLFAKAQEDAGFKREVICASLSTGKSHISEMIKLARLLPLTLLEVIGKAPSIGRGRWEEIATLMSTLTQCDDKNHWQIVLDEAIHDKEFVNLSSDLKFSFILERLAEKLNLLADVNITNTKKLSKTKDKLAQSKWQSPDQNLEITFHKKQSNLVFTLKPTLKSQNKQSAFDNGAQNSATQSTSIKAVDGFAEFLSSKLDALYSDYQQAAKNKIKGDE